jgi:P27 family predicted phage terminase small subunit
VAGNKNSGGRNKKSTQLHILQGTFRKDRHAGDETPAPPVGVPEPPGKLSKVAGAEWDRMVERLQKNRALTIVDDAVLYQYACLFAQVEEQKGATASLRKLSNDLKARAADLDGELLVEAISKIVTLQHLITRNVTQLRQGHMALRQYLVEFGMTPSARTRVKAVTSAEDEAKKGRSKFLA